MWRLMIGLAIGLAAGVGGMTVAAAQIRDQLAAIAQTLGIKAAQ